MISIRIKPLPNPSVISILGGLGLAWFSSSWGLGKHEGGGGGGGGGDGGIYNTTTVDVDSKCIGHVNLCTSPNSTFDALDFPRNYNVENIDLPCDCFF